MLSSYIDFVKGDSSFYNRMKLCVRNNLGGEFSQSDSLLTHAFSTAALLLGIGIL